MHTKTCTTANSARSAVKEIIRNQLSEIAVEIRERERKLRDRYHREMGYGAINKKLESLQKEARQLYKDIEAKVALEIKEHEKALAKRRDKLCEMRSEVLFAKAARIREMYEELESA